MKICFGLEIAQRAGGIRQPVEGGGEASFQRRTCLGQRDALRIAAKQRGARPAFKCFDMLRYRAGRDVLLLCRGDKADMPRRGLKSTHGIQRWPFGALGHYAHFPSLSFSTPRNSKSDLHCHGSTVKTS